MRIRENAFARQVKLSDLRDNAAMGRVLYRKQRTERDIQRIQQYILSYQFLTDQIDESSYRDQMSSFEDR